MWIADIPNTPPSSSPVVMVAEAGQLQPQNTLGVCETANGKMLISPRFNAQSYMYQFFGKDGFAYGATAKIIQPPKHGILAISEGTDPNNYFFDYTPDQLPSGTKDYFVVSVENKGVTVNIRYYIYIDYLQPNEPADVNYCGDKQFWKISQDANGNQVLTLIASPASATPDTTLSSSSLSSWLSLAQLDGKIADLSGVNFSVSDLPAKNGDRFILKSELARLSRTV
jgi:hypothetical protein